jgi:PAS domain S-box-containing protein
MLICLGCHIGQGWLYGKAVPAAMATEQVLAQPSRAEVAYPSRDIALNVMSALEALPRERLAQLQAIYEGAPVGICFLDRQLRYISLNQRMAEINNLPLEAHLGRTVAALLPEVHESIRPRLDDALKGVAASFELTMKGRSLLVNYQPARDEVGEVVGVSIAIIDVTHRKQAEHALRKVEAHYLNAVGNIAQISWTADPTGAVLDVSPRWSLLTGRTQEEVLGEGWQLSLHQDDLPNALAAWTKAMQTGDPLEIGYRIRSASGAWIWMHVLAIARKDHQGKVIRWYGTAEELGVQAQDRPSICDAQASFPFLNHA